MQKKIVFSPHALHQISDRGATEGEIIQAIEGGEKQPAKKGRAAFRKNFSFEKHWKGRYYSTKQVMAIVADTPDEQVVVTVFTFFFGG